VNFIDTYFTFLLISHSLDNTETTTLYYEQKKIEMGNNGDDIKIKTTDKDSDTIFYISNTEVKVIESIPTSKTYPAIYEEDVIVDVPTSTVVKNKSRVNSDKYEEDIVLSPLTSDFDPKDINYIGEAFLDVEESSNNGALIENRHIIPLTSDVVVQPVELKDMPSINVPIIGEPPQIELAEMMFSEDYDSKQQSNYRGEDFSPFLLHNRLVKNELQADVPKELVLDVGNGTLLTNKTHISVNTMINGTNMTTIASLYSNATAAITLDGDDVEGSGRFYCITYIMMDCGENCLRRRRIEWLLSKLKLDI
jgi:hypothetical protein